MRATEMGGQLKPLDKCWIKVSGISGGKITFKNLPDISDTKSAEYSDENVIGRASPIKTYSHSSSRQISITIHCVVTCQKDIGEYLDNLRLLQACVYPSPEKTSSAPFAPPKICQIKCGKLLSGGKNQADETGVCCVLKSYNVKFPIDVAWDEETYLPWKFDIDTSWEVVYSSDDLPDDTRIRRLGA